MYDLIIIGAGPAGLTASIYASRYKLSNLVIGKLPGGTITWAHRVENFPGFFSISGLELAKKMIDQVKGQGTEMLTEDIGRVEVLEKAGQKYFKVFSASGKEFLSKSLVIASGTERKKLNIPGEKEYLGRGVSYCATCDATFFKDKVVALVGGSSAACSGAVHLAEYAQKIFLIYRKEELRAEPAWVDEVKSLPEIEMIYNSNVIEVIGDGSRVSGVRLDVPFQGKNSLAVEGLFIEIGGVPASSFLIPLGVELDENNYVKVNEKMETNIVGLFAAGDVTTHSLVMSQAIVSCADGAIAAGDAYKYLKGQHTPKITGV